MLAGTQDSVAQALRVALADVVQRTQVGGVLDRLQAVQIALQLQGPFQDRGAVKVVLQRPLLAAGDHQQVGQSRPDGLLHHILDGRLVNHRQHLLRHCLGGRQEACAQSGGWNDGFSD